MTTTNEYAIKLQDKIHGFIRGRLRDKVEKLKPEETGKVAALEAAHQPDAWLADAARRVAQIQLATHILKPMHPDARGTNLRVPSLHLDGTGLVGSHSLPGLLKDDVVGNAAALDVYKFLMLEHEGRSVLDHAIDGDERLLVALSGDRMKAEEWRQAFAGVAISRTEPASDTLAKQLYFPLANGEYHLLAPLFPTSLVHEAQRTMREDRFGEAAKVAHDARRKGEGCDHGYREYPDFAIQKLGGTKPQNISQLNSERHGENWLLASLPPIWQSQPIRPPWGTESIFIPKSFGPFGRQRRVRDLTSQLRKFLTDTTYNNLAIRQYRAQLVEQICDEAHQYAARIAQLPSGWSSNSQCHLHESERLWLDPSRANDDEEFAKRRQLGDWIEQIGRRFANWLNDALSTKTFSLGENEHSYWRADLLKELSLFQNTLEVDHG